MLSNRHPTISRILSFTHTYTGQAFVGELIEAQGVVEQHGDEQWLVVGTTREAKGEFINRFHCLNRKDNRRGSCCAHD
jgi:predicted nucleotidyltransferase